MIAGVDQEVDFEEEEIVLEVGGSVQDGWTIAPLAHPGVRLIHFKTWYWLDMKLIVYFFRLKGSRWIVLSLPSKAESPPVNYKQNGSSGMDHLLILAG